MKISRPFRSFSALACLLLASCQTPKQTPLPAEPKSKIESPPPAVVLPPVKSPPPAAEVTPVLPPPVLPPAATPAPKPPPPALPPVTTTTGEPLKPLQKLSRLQIEVFSMGEADAMLVIGPPPLRRTLLVDCGEPTFTSQKF